MEHPTKMDDLGKVVPPPVIGWFLIPLTIDITPATPSYSTYKPT